MKSLQTPTDDDLTGLLPLSAAGFFVLFALTNGEKHGYWMMQEIAELSGGKMRMGPATLYTNVQRFVEQEFIEEIESHASDRRRTYRLSPSGRRLLQAELRRQEEVLRIARSRKVFASGGNA